MLHRCARVLLLVMMMSGAAAFAAEPGDLYRGRTIVTGIKDETRIPAAPLCLLDVLAKVSGDPRLFHDSRARDFAAAATLHAIEYSYRDRYALRQIHDEQGTRDRPYYLTITFDTQRVDDALKTMGRTPWTNRPKLALFLVVDNNANIYALADDGIFGRDQRDSLAAASWRVGLPVMLPSAAGLAKEGITADKLASAGPEKLKRLAKAMGAARVLTGTLVWNKGTLGWAAQWRLYDGKTAHDWAIKDVNFDEAFRNALWGSAQILSGNGEPE
jgi:hypothetical protein